MPKERGLGEMVGGWECGSLGGFWKLDWKRVMWGRGLVVGNCQIDNKDASCSQSVTECKAAGAVPVV